MFEVFLTIPLFQQWKLREEGDDGGLVGEREEGGDHDNAVKK